METAARRPVGRYGPPPGVRHRRLVTVLVAMLMVVVVSWLLWVAVGRQSAVNFTDIGFVIPDDQQVQVTFEVTKDRDVTALCTLTALDAAKGTVGLATVRIGPATGDTTRHTDTVRTSAMAVTGFVSSCDIAPGPAG